jgi:spore coat polysaccharide biosynthesis protein SpsF
MSVVCIVQARINSSRLPGKTLLLLPTGRSIVHEVLWRCLHIRGLDKLICAIPDTPDCDILEGHLIGFAPQCRPSFFSVYRGSELDVLARYHGAASAVAATNIMRVTSDCPCLDAGVASLVLDHHLKQKFDYTSNCHPRSYPRGFDVEVFTRDALTKAHIRAATDFEREHVTPYMLRDVENFIGNHMQGEDQSRLNLSVDTLEDYIRVCNHMGGFRWKYGRE